MRQMQKQGSGVDMRGFTYELTPFVRQQEWCMEVLQTQLGKSVRALNEAKAQLKKMETELQLQTAQLQKNLLIRPDAHAHQRGLSFLLQLRRRMTELRDTVEMLRNRHSSAQAACLKQQRKLDGLDEHEANAKNDYALELTRQSAAEADRDWIGRMHLRAAAPQR